MSTMHVYSFLSGLANTRSCSKLVDLYISVDGISVRNYDRAYVKVFRCFCLDIVRHVM